MPIGKSVSVHCHGPSGSGPIWQCYLITGLNRLCKVFVSFSFSLFETFLSKKYFSLFFQIVITLYNGK
ncbi:MAG: hypothetical protein A2508_07330 [Candidatus Lambdaproteobacteria bacterium RIFOXYD12_FULL_49_8]|nr:MAG: hypothetical protein A2508_07330 [Candidatus Lambdaproteobacteria bacterium RIFOXYD12_FULL_49_8]